MYLGMILGIGWLFHYFGYLILVFCSPRGSCWSWRFHSVGAAYRYACVGQQHNSHPRNLPHFDSSEWQAANTALNQSGPVPLTSLQQQQDATINEWADWSFPHSRVTNPLKAGYCGASFRLKKQQEQPVEVETMCRLHRLRADSLGFRFWRVGIKQVFGLVAVAFVRRASKVKYPTTDSQPTTKNRITNVTV